MSSIFESQRYCIITRRRMSASEQRQDCRRARISWGIDLRRKKSSWKRTWLRWVPQRIMRDRPLESGLSLSLREPPLFSVRDSAEVPESTELANKRRSISKSTCSSVSFITRTCYHRVLRVCSQPSCGQLPRCPHCECTYQVFSLRCRRVRL